MTPNIVDRYVLTVHPVHAVFLAGMFPLFLGTALSDIAYAKSLHVQWNNFAAWLLLGALVFGGIALAFAIVDLFRRGRQPRRTVPYALLLAAVWIIGVFNALVHASDAWGSMPVGLALSVVTTVLACAAMWLGLRAPYVRGTV
ncbi:hypothetical protein F1536_10340 [Achromobacter xylosoxidans]|uniref:DUF2231 domain-containing protein n=1 Tax=Achromobacter TaxID=222 RepID=UPI0006C3C660|nr:DUF2231 domain-containing protein [Achromobacter xylosoxidans]KAA5925991.1 hypothetical protein F1536_10340 [Achromobacter xylosoxidans]CUI73630.1 Predicted membrane protein [Achromobacter xylosoxidans]